MVQRVGQAFQVEDGWGIEAQSQEKSTENEVGQHSWWGERAVVGGKDKTRKVIRPDCEVPTCYIKQFGHCHKTPGELIEQILLKKWQDQICGIEIALYVYVESKWRGVVRTVKLEKAKDF